MGGRTFPTQWHVEASTTTPREQVFVLTVLRPYRIGESLEKSITVEQNETAILIRVPCAGKRIITIALKIPETEVAAIKGLRFKSFAFVDDGKRRWTVGMKEKFRP
jgi:hypothetical protein